MIDGMSIRKQLIYDQRLKRMEGYVDLGSGPQEDEGEASEALVFMVTGSCICTHCFFGLRFCLLCYAILSGYFKMFCSAFWHAIDF